MDFVESRLFVLSGQHSANRHSMSFWLGGWRFTHCVLFASLPFRFGVWRRLGELLSGREKADEDWSAKEGMAMGEMKGLLSSFWTFNRLHPK